MTDPVAVTFRLGPRRSWPQPRVEVHARARRVFPAEIGLPTMSADDDNRAEEVLAHGGLARGAVRRDGGARRGVVLDDLRRRERAALHAGPGRDRLRARPRLPGGLSVHARRLPVDVPRQALDDAPVRRLRHGRGDERALPLSARARADGPLDGVRHADADGLRLGPRARSARSAAKASRSIRSPTWRRCSRASRSARSRRR